MPSPPSESGARLIGCRVAQGVPEVGVLLVELGSRCANDQQRNALGPSARCSRNASIASSAQCRSSKTSTVGSLLGDQLEEPPPRREQLLALGR